MRKFKFLQTEKRQFGFEMMTHMSWSPLNLMNTEAWTSTRSILIREWISDLYYNNRLNGNFFDKYFPEFDRVVSIRSYSTMTIEYMDRFEVTVRISVNPVEYMEVHLQYVL